MVGNAMKRLFRLATWGCCGLLGLVAAGTPASAQFEVKQPSIHGGGAEVAWHGAYFGAGAEGVEHGHEVEVLLGVTERFGLGLAGVGEQAEGADGQLDALKLTEVEVQAKLELVELKQDGFGMALFGVLGTTTVGRQSEREALVGPILTARSGPLSATANLFAVRAFDIREGGEPEPDHWNANVNWQIRYQKSRWGLGLEGFSEFADIAGDLDEDSPDTHRVGPVFYLDLGPENDAPHGAPDHGTHEGDGHGPRLAMALGLLFGINDDTDDVALKWDVEIEF